MYQIVVTFNYPGWPEGVKMWFESLECVAGPYKKRSKAEKDLAAQGFRQSQRGGCWSRHPYGDEVFYEARIVKAATGEFVSFRLPAQRFK